MLKFTEIFPAWPALPFVPKDNTFLYLQPEGTEDGLMDPKGAELRTYRKQCEPYETLVTCSFP